MRQKWRNPWVPILLLIVLFLVVVLILDSSMRGAEITKQYEISILQVPAVELFSNAKRDDPHALQATIQTVFQQLKWSGLPVTVIGLYDPITHTIIASTQSGPLHGLVPRLLRVLAAQGVTRVVSVSPLTEAPFNQMHYVAILVDHHRFGEAATFFILPRLSTGDQMQVLLQHQFLLGSTILLAALIAVVLSSRLNRYVQSVRQEPSALANWVQALVMDPFATPPGTLELLDPLTKVILDMRSRVYLQEALIRSLLDHAPFGVTHLTPDFRVKMQNDAMTALTGLAFTETEGQSLSDLLSLLEANYLPLPISRDGLKFGESLRNVEVELTHHVIKEKRWALVSIIPHMISQGNPAGYTLFAEDMTTKRQWTTYTERTDRLNLIAELAASTAHEIRNPLTTVRGFLQLHQRRSGPSTGRDHFQIMIDEIDRVDSLISEYLTMAKHTVFTQYTLASLHTILHDLLPLVTAEANMKGIVVSVCDLPEADTLCNPQELKQVFLNLMKNAIDAMTTGGVLTIRAMTLNQTTYTISISDTGSGIAHAHLAHIFDPFYTTKSTGSGLGLAVTKKIIEAHEGEIEVETEPGVGTTFYVSLPLRRPAN